MMGRRQVLKNACEYDCLYARHVYCYLRNNPSNVKYIKRSMNKRMRRENKMSALIKVE